MPWLVGVPEPGRVARRGDRRRGLCYERCDGNGVLDLVDFLCFVNAFNLDC